MQSVFEGRWQIVAQISFHAAQSFFRLAIKKGISILRWNPQKFLVVHGRKKEPDLNLKTLCEIHCYSEACKHLSALPSLKGQIFLPLVHITVIQH